MILRNATIKYKGYDLDLLKPYSRKRVCKTCDECGRVRWLSKQAYRDLCISCNNKLNPANLGKTGENHPAYKQITLICEICNKEFKVKQSHNFQKCCSLKCMGKYRSKNFIGKNHPNYKLNITDEERLIKRRYPEYYEWRKEVYKRDNYICQICGGTNLNAHHIESYSDNKDLRTILNNGITLCEDCHNDFHHQYGRGNNTRDQFIEFMGNK